MKNGQLNEIRNAIGGRIATFDTEVSFDPFNYSVSNTLDVAERFCTRRQLQIPTPVVRDGRRVIQLVCVRPNGWLVEQMPQYPLLLKPRDVTDLPKERVDDPQSRSHELFVAQVSNQTDRLLASITDHR